jgi:hypothetical protein
MGWGKYAKLTSLAVNVNPGSASIVIGPMPFRKKCRITMENINTEDMILYYQVDYILTKFPPMPLIFMHSSGEQIHFHIKKIIR